MHLSASFQKFLGRTLWHEPTTFVPRKWDHAEVKEYTDYKKFLTAINNVLAYHKKKNRPIYFKGFGTTHAYDRELLKANFKKYDIPLTNLDIMKNAYDDFDLTEWKETPRQVKKGEWVDNQKFFFQGLSHCIADCEQLFDYILKLNK